MVDNCWRSFERQWQGFDRLWQRLDRLWQTFGRLIIRILIYDSDNDRWMLRVWHLLDKNWKSKLSVTTTVEDDSVFFCISDHCWYHIQHALVILFWGTVANSGCEARFCHDFCPIFVHGVEFRQLLVQRFVLANFLAGLLLPPRYLIWVVGCRALIRNRHPRCRRMLSGERLQVLFLECFVAVSFVSWQLSST